jgi:hypothetical protein
MVGVRVEYQNVTLPPIFRAPCLTHAKGRTPVRPFKKVLGNS